MEFFIFSIKVFKNYFLKNKYFSQVFPKSPTIQICSRNIPDGLKISQKSSLIPKIKTADPLADKVTLFAGTTELEKEK